MVKYKYISWRILSLFGTQDYRTYSTTLLFYTRNPSLAPLSSQQSTNFNTNLLITFRSAKIIQFTYRIFADNAIVRGLVYYKSLRYSYYIFASTPEISVAISSTILLLGSSEASFLLLGIVITRAIYSSYRGLGSESSSNRNLERLSTTVRSIPRIYTMSKLYLLRRSY